MIDLKLVQEIAAHLRPLFPTVYVGGQHENTPITLPALLLDMKSEGVVGGPLQRGTLTAEISSQADDSNPASHADLTKGIGEAINSLTGVYGPIFIAGVVYESSDSFRSERHFQTNLQFIVGYYETI